MTAQDALLDVIPVAQDRRPNTWTALAALFWLTLRQHARGRRLLVLGLLFLIPAGIAVLARSVNKVPPKTEDLEFLLVFYLIPHALLPLAALLYASGMVQDEVEDQTLTYLLIRPMPRPGIYGVKLLATILATTALAALFTALAFVAIYAGSAEMSKTEIADRTLKTIAVMAASLVAYCAGFGWLGLAVRRSLVIGLGYIIVFEGVVANIPFVVRNATIMYYFRVLAERWVGVPDTEWQIDLPTAPNAWTSLAVLLGIGVIASLLASWLFATREFRLKTPEGS